MKEYSINLGCSFSFYEIIEKKLRYLAYQFTQKEFSMQELSTSDYLIKKLYNETEPTENQAIEAAFERNVVLKERYEEMKKSKELLDAVANSDYQVKPESLEKILTFSKLTQILNHKN